MYHQFINAQLARMDVAVTSILKIQEAAEQISARLSRGSAILATLDDQLVTDIVAAAKATEETRKDAYSKLEKDQTALDALITDLEKERKIVKEAKDSIEEHLKTGGKDSATADLPPKPVTTTPGNQTPLNATITMAEQKTDPATMTVTPPTLSNARPSELLPKVNPLTDNGGASQLATPVVDPATKTHDSAPSTTITVTEVETEEPLPYTTDDGQPTGASRKESDPRGRSVQRRHHDSPTKRHRSKSRSSRRVSYRSRSRSRSTQKPATNDRYKARRRDTPRKKTVRRSEEPSRSQTNRYNKKSRDNTRSTKDTRHRNRMSDPLHSLMDLFIQNRASYHPVGYTNTAVIRAWTSVVDGFKGEVDWLNKNKREATESDLRLQLGYMQTDSRIWCERKAQGKKYNGTATEEIAERGFKLLEEREMKRLRRVEDHSRSSPQDRKYRKKSKNSDDDEDYHD